MHDLPGVVGTGVGVVGTEKNKQKVMHFREGLLISLFPRLLSPHVINSKGKVTMLTQIMAENNKLCLANSPYKRKLHEGCVLRYSLQMIPSTQIPLFASLAFSYKSLKESTLNTLLGPEAIWLSSVVSTSSPIPKTNTAAPLLWRRDEALSSGVYAPWSFVCFPAVITKTGYKRGKEELPIWCKRFQRTAEIWRQWPTYQEGL